MAIISNGRFSDAVGAERLDAEFFDPADLAIIERLKMKGAQPLGLISTVLNGRTPEAYSPDGGIPIVRSGDLVSPLIYRDCGREFLYATRTPRMVFLKIGDVLISSIGMGSIGKISLVMDASNFATVSEVTILRSTGYPQEVLFAYLSTKAGQRQIQRQVTGATGQQHLLKSKVETILIPPAPDKSVCNAIRRSCRRAWELEIEAAKQHARTHAVFAKTIGL
jgi:type I restriction enzyme, S subunit